MANNAAWKNNFLNFFTQQFQDRLFMCLYARKKERKQEREKEGGRKFETCSVG
jgi:hypothetical protein